MCVCVCGFVCVCVCGVACEAQIKTFRVQSQSVGHSEA